MSNKKMKARGVKGTKKKKKKGTRKKKGNGEGRRKEEEREERKRKNALARFPPTRADSVISINAPRASDRQARGRSTAPKYTNYSQPYNPRLARLEHTRGFYKKNSAFSHISPTETSTRPTKTICTFRQASHDRIFGSDIQVQSTPSTAELELSCYTAVALGLLAPPASFKTLST